ncbi:MAG: hypothetical protein KJ548_01430 [Actinobacteria bacterium]|nr:hypothetical protein [Actinomycetota bacterium]MCG2797311.1 hypothetical protein [Cellulomonas sp.]
MSAPGLWGAVPGAEHENDEPGAEAENDPTEPEDAKVAKPRSYTWLHLVVLALVAFVLGWVIFLLLDSASTSTTGAQAFTAGLQTVVDTGPPAR